MDSAVAGEQSGEGAFVAGAGPGFAACLTWEWAHGSLVGEAVAVFVGALAAGVVAVQAGAAGSSGDAEFGGAPCTGPMCGARVGDDWHLLVVPHRCDTVAPGPAPGPGAGISVLGPGFPVGSAGGVVVVSFPRQSSVTKPPLIRGRVTSQTIGNGPGVGRFGLRHRRLATGPGWPGSGYVTDDSRGAEQ